jgi:endonuclease/exonuclease/phosphatase family metal-dependent hydrolase
MRVMTYNLLYGFHERAGDAMVYRPERARAAAEVVRAAAPDVLALTEAAYVDADGRFVRQDFAALFGLPHVACAGFVGSWGNALLSRYPITRAARLPLGSHPGGAPPSALRAMLDVDGRALCVDVVHPSPHITEAERVAAFAPLLAGQPRPALLLGDLNALSDEDPYDAATLAAQLRGRVPDPEALAARMLDRQLVAAVRAAGLVDVMPRERRRHTLPTRLPRAHTQGAELRIDYVFASPEVRVVDAAVVREGPVDEVSDHYPVVATLEL